jgi:hypothetical protein
LRVTRQLVAICRNVVMYITTFLQIVMYITTFLQIATNGLVTLKDFGLPDDGFD